MPQPEVPSSPNGPDRHVSASDVVSNTYGKVRSTPLRHENSNNIIGNSFSMFAARPDPKEARYLNPDTDDDNYNSNMPFSDDDMRSVEAEDAGAPIQRVASSDSAVDPVTNLAHDEERQKQPARANTSSHFSSFRRSTTTLFGPKPNSVQFNDENRKSSRNLFNIFRKKTKDKDRRPEVADGDADSLEPSSDDIEAAKRAVDLLNALTLGGPAVNLVASCFCEDEHGIARAPLLLSLMSMKVTDISRSPLTKNRKFKIDLQYGVAPQRIKWSIEKTAKDVLYLHSRLKWLGVRTSFKTSDLPKYPVPPLLKRNTDLRVVSLPKPANGTPNISSPNQAPRISEEFNNDVQSNLSNHSLRERFSTLRAHFSAQSSISSAGFDSPEQMRTRAIKNQQYTLEIENYLKELIIQVAMRPQSNRLFQFFEISPISSLLNYETGYIGKQGVIHVGGTARSQGWRVGHFKANDLKSMIDRRSEKWFLVRGSYVMYVPDIISTTPLEVFMVDPSFKILGKGESLDPGDGRGSDLDSDYAEESQSQVEAANRLADKVQDQVFTHLKITLENNERKLVILPKSRIEQKLWLQSLNEMVKSTVWAEKHRFNSFAPVRKNCYAQWLVDARDYFWAASAAMEMAKDVIFIHDWWLSPELYLRRPANGNQQFRIDRILQRKAQQGVKIFVIVYRNVGTIIPIDSLYTKHSIVSLNQENIHIIRSPNQLLQNTFFWAHHEKLCIVDYNVAFIGGLDLCYGRYDTPDHVLSDDSNIGFTNLDQSNLTPEQFDSFNIFPGKDYSNTRVKDFSNLDKPYETLYDRNTTPRMPWHDIHMMTSGEVARDLSRHFVQRWNYLLRQKRPSRLTPLLTPPPDLTPEQLNDLNLTGSCEVQILRSAGNWSLGLKEHEESIHQAYLKLIENSEHCIYIENQFFVTSCFIDGTEIKNRVGDAIVDRIIRAKKEGTAWRAIIVIPLVPGFESQVDQIDGSSVRVVMQCQYMSISRGTSSLFAKLRKAGINPDDYIQFFSLRKWGILGPDRTLVTEQLYIHAKTMIVDDRIAIIGSANINERSMRGSRDSEVAAIVRDTETIKSTMNGQAVRVGKFAHTLRMRLMREHLGVAVDILDVVERKFEKILQFAKTEDGLKAQSHELSDSEGQVLSAAVELAARYVLQESDGTPLWRKYQESCGFKPEIHKVPFDATPDDTAEPMALPISFNNRTGPREANVGIRERKKHSFDPRVQQNINHKRDVYGEGIDKYRSKQARLARLDNAKYLKRLAHAYEEDKPNKSFLPDINSVYMFLDSDEEHHSQAETNTRNREKWLFLKKIAYLQRVAARDAEQSEIERKRRVAAGLPSCVRASTNISAAKKLHKDVGASHSPESSKEQHSDSPARSSDVNGLVQANDVVSDVNLETQDATTGESITEQIPIVTLDDEAFKETMRGINAQATDIVTKFVDPYCFQDPLDPEFYEDLWYEIARKNTDIFRLIFHCQPDDTVRSWATYMQFMKLNKGFQVSQARDADSRREKRLFESERPGQESKSHQRKSSHATINISDYQPEAGILGDIPSGDRDRQGRSGERARFNVPDSIAEHDDNRDGDASSLETEGEEGDDDDLIDSSSESRSERINGEANGSVNGKADGKSFDAKKRSDTTKKVRRRAGTFSNRRRAKAGEKIFERDSAQRVLEEIQGHLVLFPVDWLQRELDGENWFFNTDRIPPIEIYD
ncbi:hypothetical protein PUMCH_000119 [Australozyma saopauloensis]|uniref:Phospholipase n=1 Tax=Australozyma saopauloensis TaxID=291208 RepID=A0AAX4H325_9ASCO|nr:hypothetical protein PUMCH_000119 [[Candida] saopauloensis]